MLGEAIASDSAPTSSRQNSWWITAKTTSAAHRTNSPTFHNVAPVVAVISAGERPSLSSKFAIAPRVPASPYIRCKKRRFEGTMQQYRPIINRYNSIAYKASCI